MARARTYGLILAGGRGTRFWPRSRKRSAKQVLSVVGPRTLIQATVDRLEPLIPPERLWVLTNDYLKAEIIRQLPEIPRKQVLAEPVQRNTAPAIGLAAHSLSSLDPDAVMGVFPSDQIVERPVRFRQLVRAAYQAAGEGKLVVMGLYPRWPETGYGYVEFPEGTRAGELEAVPVVSFREKPDDQTARKFLSAGRFYWNSGMFFWRASRYLDELRKHLPKTATILSSLPDFGRRQFSSKLKQAFPLCDNISVDYAVMEKAAGVVGVPCDDIGWNDVGSWKAVYELLPRDSDGNAFRSEALPVDSHGNYVDAHGKLVALLGVSNLIVVDTPDALLVADRQRAQQVGEIVKLLEKKNREELL